MKALREFTRHALDFYTTRMPYHRGKWRIVEAAVRATGLDAADAGRTFEVGRAGIRWLLDPRCAVQRRLLYHGGFDIHDVRALLGGIGPDTVFFDVGSYFGYYALLAAARGARVFAFEPDAGNYELLRQHQAMNRFDRLKTFRRALSDAPGIVRFALASGENRGRGRIARDADAGLPAEEVEATTLDAFAAEVALERLDALKLDVEGAELKVLAGGAATLRRFRPLLLVEINRPCLARFGHDESDLVRALEALGYRLHRAGARGLTPFRGLAADEAYANVVCRPESR